MSLKYPESVGDHVRELRRNFHTALHSTKPVHTKVPISEHVSNLIRSGIRKGFAERLLQDECSIFHSKQARKEVEDMIHLQISSELFGQIQASTNHDVVPRAILRSLYASFDDLSHKYEARAANLEANMQLAGTNKYTAPASPTETGIKMEDRSSSPPSWQQNRNSPILNKANDKAIVVSFVDHLVGPTMNDVELTRLVNQSIGSDPEIPSHLSDSDWITGANLLDSGEIEVHMETEDDRDFLALNTHWRPKLEQTLAARNRMFTEAVDKFPYPKFNSMLRADEDPGNTRVGDIQNMHWEQDMTETKGHIPVVVSCSRPGQASQVLEKGFPWERGYGTFSYNDQQKGGLTTEREQSYLPSQETDVFEKPRTLPSHPSLTQAQILTYAELVGPTISEQAALTDTTVGYRKRGAHFSGAFSGSEDTTKRLKVTVDEQ